MSLIATRFGQADYARNIWLAKPDHQTDPKDLLKPEFWLHVAAVVKVLDRIEVIPESGEYFAELIVVDQSKTSLRVRLLRFVPLIEGSGAETTGEDVSNDPDFEVAWRGGAKWTVLRKVDKVMIYRDMPSRDAALAKLAEHVKAKAA